MRCGPSPARREHGRSPLVSKPVRARVFRRHTAFRTIRALLDAHDFLEIDTPLLVPGPGLEPHIDPLSTSVTRAPGASPVRRFLITSPELAMKRALAAGCERIYQLGHVFRDGETTARHAAEFTMLEWYRAGGTLQDLVADCEGLLRALADALAGTRVVSGVDLDAPFERRTVVELFAACADIDLLDALTRTDDGDADALPRAARAVGLSLREGADFEDAFFQVMSDKVEPVIGRARPCVVARWPARMAVLARRCDDEPRLAERFEIYAAGLELCNAFDELTDPVEQRARFVADNAARHRLGKEELPLDEEFLTALASMPPSVGNALGVDRALMLVCGIDTLDDVLALPARW